MDVQHGFDKALGRKEALVLAGKVGEEEGPHKFALLRVDAVVACYIAASRPRGCSGACGR